VQLRHPGLATEDDATVQVVFVYRGVQVQIWTALTDPELIRPLLRVVQR